MPTVVIGLVVVALVLGGVMWLTFSLVGLLLTLFMAGLVGWAADAVVPGRLPGGWLGSILAGIVGGFVGSLLIGNLGPSLFDVRVIPAFVGALVVVVAAQLALGARSGRALR